MEHVDHIIQKIADAKQELRKWEREYEIAQANCSHLFRRERDNDGHTTMYIYTCTKCYWMTLQRPLDDLK